MLWRYMQSPKRTNWEFYTDDIEISYVWGNTYYLMLNFGKLKYSSSKRSNYTE
jgi:hypothetical protein